MPEFINYPLDGVEDSGDELMTIDLWYDVKEDAVYTAEIPDMNDENADLFFDEILDYFYRQGGYLKKCKYCGQLFSYFPFGIKYSHCIKCTPAAEDDAEKCTASFRERKAQEAAEREQKKELKEHERLNARVERVQRKKTLAIPIDHTYPGYIYLMSSENGLHKIGRAKDIHARRKGLEREIPIRVEIIHFFETDNSLEAERIIHNRYAAQRVRYEWFSLSPEQVEEIKSIPDFGIDKIR